MALISVNDALKHILSDAGPLGLERVPLDQARGRVLGASLGAKLTQPPFDASAMDGYAVRADDVASLPAALTLVGESAAGSRFNGVLQPGQAVRIFTGAPVPDGADTIAIQEDVDRDGNSVVVKEARPGRHIRPKGQDFTEGEMLLHERSRLGARALMLAAAMNHADVLVRRKPIVAILSTGDEVVPAGDVVGPDQIVASVSHGIAALVAELGAEPLDLSIVPDDEEALVKAIKRGAEADVLVTIGGASVGDRDLMKTALSRAGMDIVFSKVAIRPGKPVFFGRIGAQRVLGLPGNPVSAYVCACVFLQPLLICLIGGETPFSRQEATLLEALPANGSRAHYRRAVSTYDENGARCVRAMGTQDSSLVQALSEADCLIVQDPNSPALRAGAKVMVQPLLD